MKVIIDNNLWISFAIGKKLSMLRKVILSDHIDVYVCDELIAEFVDVTHRDKIRKYISEDDIISTLQLMEVSCIFAKCQKEVSSPVRDAKDLYLLSLAESVDADYIVTGDKDLLCLISHGKTQILTFNEFLEILN